MHESTHYFIGKSPAAKRVRELIAKVAPYDSNVLILGESGTGKEVVARCVYEQSSRANNAFHVLNCAGVPRELEASEFFGHEKGSYTGADKKRDGILVRADKGTLFLDELGELSPSAQAKLLRALQEKEVLPVGSSTTKKFDVRLIFATNEDIDAMVSTQLLSQGSKLSGESTKRMRADFFYRIGGIRIEIPPLRERLEDLPLLVEHCLKDLGPRFNKPNAKLTDAALQKLTEHKFPGNVRELRSVLERALTFSDTDNLDAEHMTFTSWEKHWELILNHGINSAVASLSNVAISYDDVIEECSRVMVTVAWRKSESDLKKAAKSLGKPEKWLIQQLQHFKIANF